MAINTLVDLINWLGKPQLSFRYDKFAKVAGARRRRAGARGGATLPGHVTVARPGLGDREPGPGP